MLQKVALALQVSLEQLISAPRSTTRHFPRASLPTVARGGGVTVCKLLPDKVPGMQIDRMEIPPGRRMAGVLHTPGTREYLTCEAGTIELWVTGEKFALAPGDVVVFRGDQRHSYGNPGRSTAVGYSVVMLAPLG